jgi:type I restriction enzyme S subunit
MVSGSPYGKRYFAFSSKQTTNLASINSTQLKAFPIPVPDLDEQERIILILESFDREVNCESDNLSKLRIIKQGLMQDLLSGQVRVTGS